LKLHDFLTSLGDLLPSEDLFPDGELYPGGELRAYFQPGPTITMQYPCLVYKRDGSFVRHADNIKYILKKRWTVTVIDRNPDSDIPDLVENLSKCEFDRFYPAGGLNHWVYSLIY
jgi:hypothetical protein